MSGYGSNDIHFGGGGRARSEVERVELREWLLALAKKTERFEIEQSPEKVTIVHGEAGVRTFYFGRKSARNADDGQLLEVEARWDGPRLVLNQNGQERLEGGGDLRAAARRQGDELVRHREEQAAQEAARDAARLRPRHRGLIAGQHPPDERVEARLAAEGRQRAVRAHEGHPGVAVFRGLLEPVERLLRGGPGRPGSSPARRATRTPWPPPTPAGRGAPSPRRGARPRPAPIPARRA